MNRRVLNLVSAAFGLTACMALVFDPALLAQSNSEKFRTVNDPAPNQFVVVLRGEAPANASEFLDSYHAAVTHQYHALMNGFAVTMTNADAAALSNDVHVASVQESARYRLAGTGSTQPAPPAGLDRLDQPKLPLDLAYTHTHTGTGVHVFIVDTGVNLTHTDFSGRIEPGASFNPPSSAADDCNAHGTAVAGVVAGTTYGVAKDALLTPVKVFSCSGSSDTGTILAGLDWILARHQRPAVVVLSFTTDFDPAMDKAVEAMAEANLTVVAAAGNQAKDASLITPAHSTAAITVGATDTLSDTVASFSNFGSSLSVFAPGTGIVTASIGSPTAHQTAEGTSISAAHVAGLAALFLEQYPFTPPVQVRNWVMKNAVPVVKNVPEGTTPLLANVEASAVISAASQQKSGSSLSPSATRSSPVTAAGPTPDTTINDYVDSIPLLTAAPSSDPKPTGSSTPQQVTLNGVDFTDTNTPMQETVQSVKVATYDTTPGIYPGALVQGASVATGVLAPIPLPRAPQSITVINEYTATGSGSRSVDNPNLATITTATKDLLQSVMSPTAPTPAKLSLFVKTAYSVEQGMLDAGVNVKWLSGNAGATFSFKSSSRQSAVAVRFVQSYYTAAAQSPSSPMATLASSVTLDGAKRFIGPGNPAAYVESVTYGRVLIALFESSDSSSELNSAVNAAFTIGSVGASAHLTDQQTQTLQTSTVQVFALGGSSAPAIQLLSGDILGNLQTYLNAGANFSANSPGLPISYTVRYLKDDSLAAMSVTTDYVQSTWFAKPAFYSGSVGLGKNGPGRLVTPITVRPGDLISISANGSVWSGVIFTTATGPNGWYTWSKPSQGGFPNMFAHPFSLLYGVGDYGSKNESDSPPLCGEGFSGRVYNGNSGKLILLINSNNYGVGSGAYHFNIEVDRANN